MSIKNVWQNRMHVCFDLVLKKTSGNGDEEERQTKTHYSCAKLHVEVKNNGKDCTLQLQHRVCECVCVC